MLFSSLSDGNNCSAFFFPKHKKTNPQCTKRFCTSLKSLLIGDLSKKLRLSELSGDPMRITIVAWFSKCHPWAILSPSGDPQIEPLKVHPNVDISFHLEDHFRAGGRTGITFRPSPFMNMILGDLNFITRNTYDSEIVIQTVKNEIVIRNTKSSKK